MEELLSVKEKQGLSNDAADDICPEAVPTTGSLRKLTVDLADMEFDKNFFCMVQANAGLQELNVSYYRHSMLYTVENIIKTWYQSSSHFRLSLIGRLDDTRGRAPAQLPLQGCNGELPGSTILAVQILDTKFPLRQQNELDAPVDMQLIQWDCGHTFSLLSDYSESFLDMSTQQPPPVLTLFTLDISQMTRTGLALVQRVFWPI
ncbi:hypothetical protein BG006_004914 [Podila minutissima]|uniref:Uncharacterized protein n=1 Tax=Podila minutissima TaxID=64525 RepID=A0A9P5VMN0_9FUNG|nr:hypothetical protein BG006_004914 [Podila minutissima]